MYILAIYQYWNFIDARRLTAVRVPNVIHTTSARQTDMVDYAQGT